MKKNPLLSVIVPVYQSAPYLKTCVDSILDQTFRDFELILVDDGSSDDGPAMCDAYSRMDSRVIVIHKQNEGLVSARKTGLLAAKGEWVTNIDSDDWIDPDGFAGMYAIAVEHEADIIAASAVMHCGDETRPFSNVQTAGVYAVPEDLIPLKRQLMFKGALGSFGVLPNIWCKWFKREVLVPWQMRVDDAISLGEDAACCFPAILAAERIYITELCYYHYVRRDISMTRSMKTDAYEKADRIMAYMHSLLDEFADPVYEFRKQLARYHFYLLRGALDKDLGIWKGDTIQAKIRRMAGRMRQMQGQEFRYACLSEVPMERIERLAFRNWEAGKIYRSIFLMFIVKVRKKIGL